MLTIKAEVLRKDLRVDGTYNVKIRFTYKREVKNPPFLWRHIINKNGAHESVPLGNEFVV